VKVGDLVRLIGSKIMRMGLIIEIENPDDFVADSIMTPWHKCLILWPTGYLHWDFDIDLELEGICNESR